jgi:hypothetical protein
MSFLLRSLILVQPVVARQLQIDKVRQHLGRVVYLDRLTKVHLQIIGGLYDAGLFPPALRTGWALAAIMATIKVMRRIFDVLTRDRQLATANIVRGCPDDWKQGDGAALACMTHRSNHNQNNDVCPPSFLGFYSRDRGLVLQAEMAAAQRSA